MEEAGDADKGERRIKGRGGGRQAGQTGQARVAGEAGEEGRKEGRGGLAKREGKECAFLEK